MVAGDPRPDRSDDEHGRPLHSGSRRRQGDIGELRPSRARVLLLPERELHELQLSARRGDRQLDQRRDDVERGAAARGPDVTQLAREHQPGPDGR